MFRHSKPTFLSPYNKLWKILSIKSNFSSVLVHILRVFYWYFDVSAAFIVFFYNFSHCLLLSCFLITFSLNSILHKIFSDLLLLNVLRIRILHPILFNEHGLAKLLLLLVNICNLIFEFVFIQLPVLIQNLLIIPEQVHHLDLNVWLLLDTTDLSILLYIHYNFLLPIQWHLHTHFIFYSLFQGIFIEVSFTIWVIWVNWTGDFLSFKLIRIR